MQSFKQVWSVVAKKLTYNVNFAALLLLQKAPKNNYLYVSIYRTQWRKTTVNRDLKN